VDRRSLKDISEVEFLEDRTSKERERDKDEPERKI
jgi:hypothetical protein